LTGVCFLIDFRDTSAYSLENFSSMSDVSVVPLESKSNGGHPNHSIIPSSPSNTSQLKVIVLERGVDGLGFSIVGELRLQDFSRPLPLHLTVSMGKRA